MQKNCYDGVIPFFSRESADYNGFRLEYIVHSPEELNLYEPEADRLIKENKISHQCVDICAGEEIKASIGADWTLDERGIIYTQFLDVIEHNEEAKAIKALEGKFFNADEAARAVIAYTLRRECL